MARPQPPPQGSALLQGCILPAHPPAQGIRGFSQRKDRQSCAVVATPVIPGRTDVEVTPGKLGRRLGSPVQGGGGSCSALSHSPSASHRSPARSDTRHLRQRRAPALGWPGWMSVAPWKVKKNKTKPKNRQILPPTAAFLCRKKDLIGTGACAERGRGPHQLPTLSSGCRREVHGQHPWVRVTPLPCRAAQGPATAKPGAAAPKAPSVMGGSGAEARRCPWLSSGLSASSWAGWSWSRA